MAGVIGTDKFAYDVWGDTVNIGKRMEEQGGREEFKSPNEQRHKSNNMTREKSFNFTRGV